MPSYKGERVHGVSLLAMGVVPGTVDNQTCVGEVCTHGHKTRTYARTRIFASYCLLIAKKLPSNAQSREPGHLGKRFAVRVWLTRLSNA